MFASCLRLVRVSKAKVRWTGLYSTRDIICEYRRKKVLDTFNHVASSSCRRIPENYNITLFTNYKQIPLIHILVLKKIKVR